MSRILAAVDGSPHALDAARWALALAGSPGELTLASAWNVVLYPGEVALVPLAELERSEQLRAEQALDAAEQSLGVAGKAHRLLLRGPAANALSEEGARPRYAAVVVGSRGLGAISRVLLGSVANKVVHSCPAPVWVVHGKAPQASAGQVILVGVDHSPIAARAAEAAARAAARLGVGVKLLYCSAPIFLPPATYAEAIQKIKSEEAALAHRLLGELRARLEPTGVSVQTEHATGEAAATLLVRAHDASVCAVAVGSHGSGILGRALLGSTSHHLLNASEKPVLIVK